MRIERDSMGEVQVPDDAYYGASTQRAKDNFPISGLVFSRRFIWALGLIKAEAARTNGELGTYAAELAEAVAAAADKVVAGEMDEQFVLDVFQTGSATSTNTNANEVIANLATEAMGGERGSRLAHPNDHVNQGQSSNDVIPTAIHIAAVAAIREDLLPALDGLAGGPRGQGHRVRRNRQVGSHPLDGRHSGPARTGVLRATPPRSPKGKARLEAVLPDLEELALGGTAVGTGINAPEGFAAKTIARIADRTGMPFREADNHFEAQAAKDAAVAASGALKTVATVAVQDRQRPALAVVGPPHRHRRDQAPVAAAGLLDHARQGEPGDPGSR